MNSKEERERKREREKKSECDGSVECYSWTPGEEMKTIHTWNLYKLVVSEIVFHKTFHLTDIMKLGI